MSWIQVDFDGVSAVIEKYQQDAVSFDSDLSDMVPENIAVGEVSDVIAALVAGLMDQGANLAVYGQAVAIQAQRAVDDLRLYDEETALALLKSLLGLDDEED